MEYERSVGENIKEDMKCAILIGGIPKDIRHIMQVNADRDPDYKKLRQQLKVYMDSGRVWNADVGDPMVVGMVGDYDYHGHKGKNKYKGKDKCKYKDKGKGTKTHKSKTKDAGKANG